MNQTDQDTPLILVVENDESIRHQLRQNLEQEGYRVVEAIDKEQCLDAYTCLDLDLVLLDDLMPGTDGITCCSQLKNLSENDVTPILIFTDEKQKSVEQVFEAGAADYVSKPIQWAVLKERIRRLIAQSQLNRELKKANELLQRLATLDRLTGLANRNRFNEMLEREWRRMAREQLHLSLILCDIDFFKVYNSTYGNPKGDDCLKQLAQAISSVARRPADFVARYGSEEFAVMLPNTPAEGAAHVAEQIQAKVRALEIVHENSPVSEFVTLSLGVASIIPQPNSFETQLLTTANEALEQAKEQGRDRIILQAIQIVASDQT